jgi:hypothetical protein
VAEDKRVSELWIYIGRRFDPVDKKICYAHLDAEQRQLNYNKKIVGDVIGGQYEVKVDRTGDGASVTRGTYAYKGYAPAIANHRAEWLAQDVAAQVQKDTHDRERKDAGEQLDSLTVGQLREVAKRMLPQQRRALLAHLLSVLR